MKRVVIVFFLLVSLSIIPSYSKAQDRDLERKMCPAGDCRRDIEIELKKKDGSIYKNKFSLFPPPVQGGQMLTILPGEKLYIEADFAGEKASLIKSISKMREPSKTLTLYFEQTADVGDGTHMLLTINNPFKKTLKYHARMMTLDEKVTPTSSCPIKPGLTNYEHWQHPIFQLVITDFRFIKDDESLKCEY
jgi:hypothetical protein